MNNKQEEFEKLTKELKDLAVEYQRPLAWVVDNFKIIKILLMGAAISNDELNEYILQAQKNKDYTLAILLHFKEVLLCNSKKE